MTSLEFTEWLAYCEIQPFGDEVADLRHGTATALLANVNRDRELHPEPYAPKDFIRWGDIATEVVETEPVLIEDPVAHSNLMRAAMFGIAPRPANPEA